MSASDFAKMKEMERRLTALEAKLDEWDKASADLTAKASEVPGSAYSKGNAAPLPKPPLGLKKAN